MIKLCPNCKITVMGTQEYCPLCQNELYTQDIQQSDAIRPDAAILPDDEEGKPENKTTSCLSPEDNHENMAEKDIIYFPAPTKLKQMSFFYKLQLFVFLAAIVICLSIDFLLDISGKIHWSLIVSAWIIGLQITIKRLIRKHSLPVYFISNISIMTGILLSATAYYCNFFRLCTDYMLPGICMLSIVLNFVFFWMDNTGNTLVYILCNALIGIVPAVILSILYDKAPVLWIISMISSILLLLSLIIFIGRRVKTEILKRLNI